MATETQTKTKKVRIKKLTTEQAGVIATPQTQQTPQPEQQQQNAFIFISATAKATTTKTTTHPAQNLTPEQQQQADEIYNKINELDNLKTELDLLKDQITNTLIDQFKTLATGEHHTIRIQGIKTPGIKAAEKNQYSGIPTLDENGNAYQIPAEYSSHFTKKTDIKIKDIDDEKLSILAKLIQAHPELLPYFETKQVYIPLNLDHYYKLNTTLQQLVKRYKITIGKLTTTKN
jgi:hypothetical protein